MAKLEDTISLHRLVYLGVQHLTWVICQATASGAAREAVAQDVWEKMVADERFSATGKDP